MFTQENPRDVSSGPPVTSLATLTGARGNMGALRVAQIALIAGVAAGETFRPGNHSRTCWQTSVANRVSFVQDGSHETDEFDAERKSCDPGRARARETRHKSTQCQQSNSTSSHWVVFHNTVGISRMNWAPPVFYHPAALYQPLGSGPGVDDVTEFYCTRF